MDTSTLKYRINLYSLYVLSFAIPFHKKAIAPLIIIFLLSSLFNGNYNFKNKSKSILLFATIFIAYIAGMLYTENTNFGLKDLETKLSLLIFPIAFYVSKIDFKSISSNALKWFVYGVVISSLICLGEALYQFTITGEESELFYGKLSMFHHASYFSMYVNLALIIVYYIYFKSKTSFQLNSIQTVSLSAFLSIIIILLSSKLGIISMLITQLFAISFWTIKYKSYTKSLLALFIILAGLGTTYKFSYSFNVRVNEFISTLTSGNASKESTTGVRVYAWRTSIDLIKEKPIIGYGTGDVKSILVAEYIKQNLTVLAEKELNPHNQFLQTAVAIGVIGALILLLILILPLVNSIKKQHYIYAFFILLFILNNLTESMLETQSGVIFYGFFNALFFATYFSNYQLKDNH